MARAATPKGWQFVDEVEPPKGEPVLVLNDKGLSIAKLRRGRFIAQAEGIDALDPWEKPLEVKGVTHWHPLPAPPQ